MRVIYPDENRGYWQRQKYYLDRGYAKPVPGAERKWYNPFDFYEPSKTTGNLHHIFASLNLENEKEIEAFYSQYGPLGIFNQEILKIVSFNPTMATFPNGFKLPDNSPYAGVERISNELVPMRDLIDTFNIPEERFVEVPEDAVVMPNIRITALDTWEKISDFVKECKTFKWVIELYNAIADKDIKKTRMLLSEGGTAYKKTVNEADDQGVLISATGAVMFEINGKLENMASPKLDFDSTGNEVSKRIIWVSDSLLTSLYLMLFMDITRGVFLKRCPKCNTVFETSRFDAVYCSTKHERSAKQEKYREKVKKVYELHLEGKTVNAIMDIIESIYNERPAKERIINWIKKKGRA